MKIIIFLLFFSSFHFSQVDTTLNILHTRNNVILFADYLFCEGDYLRASFEYKKLNELSNDTILFKYALSLKRSNLFEDAIQKFSMLKNNSLLKEYSQLETFSINYLIKDFRLMDETFFSIQNSSLKTHTEKLYYYSYLSRESLELEENLFISYFNEDEKPEIKSLYKRKLNPAYKSPVLAAFLSTLLPGAGKLYTGEYSDGVFAAILTGVFAYLSYDNFRANHKFRGWLFGGLSAFFYGGNIYGSAASAQLFNAKIDFNFNLDVESFIKRKNYFLPEYGFLCDR